MSESDQETLRAAFVRLFGEEPAKTWASPSGRLAMSAESDAGMMSIGLAPDNSTMARVSDYGVMTVNVFGPDWRQNLARAEAAVMAAREIK